MQSLTYFSDTQTYEDTQHEMDWVAYTEDTDLVHVDKGKTFKYVIHAEFNITNPGTSQICGADLLNFAKFKIEDPDQKISVINPVVSYNFEKTGTYVIHYGLFDETKMPASTFASCPNLIWFQADEDITYVGVIATYGCPRFTGCFFGGNYPEFNYPETQVFDTPYSKQDVIINNHITHIENFANECPSVRNVYIDSQEITTNVGGVLRNTVTPNGMTKIPSTIYIGKDVNIVSNYARISPNQDKVIKYIVHPEHPVLMYDETVHALILKSTYGTNRIEIVCGVNVDYLKISDPYRISSYESYRGRFSIRIVNLSEYTGQQQKGFIDCSGIETLIMGPDVNEVPVYNGGLAGVKNLIIPVKTAPILRWGDNGIGTENTLGKYSFITAADLRGSLGSRVSSYSDRNIYVLKGTQAEQDTWNNDFDTTTSENWGNHRPNLWGTNYVQTKWEDAPPAQRGTKTSTIFGGFTIHFLTQQEMTDLINSLIPNN